jgi:hypothetical protein
MIGLEQCNIAHCLKPPLFDGDAPVFGKYSVQKNTLGASAHQLMQKDTPYNVLVNYSGYI